ncbi:MAG: CoB--CoM heterodisulfide reductase iron-sulfur subunit B family protein, partial [Coriobacteriia bacterium]|nr:CoB--CoM heterodisulfide reductase iron-sulfur subunit B family protein [Coriobacteriia bacterium]
MSASMRYAYFPGCSAAGSGISFTLSGDYVVNKIGLELVEIPDWCCCGTSAALLTDRNLALALPGRSLAIAEADPSTAGLDVATPCAGCFASLKGVQHYVRQSQKHREFVESLVEMPYAASAEIFSLLELMCKDTPREAIDTTISHSLRGVKVACYYGCALVRPPKVTQFDDPENPQSMEGLLALTGAEPVDWAFKVECCGAAHQITEPKNARVLVERIFEDAAANGAEVIATACPLCWMNLDLRLGEINKHRAEEGKPIFDIPVYYFTQLLGLAMGG